ncbi:MAG: hypothetical protein L3J15_03915 [Devosiaceae bacterium]|nr:hypothetical protein [Devosiaceae bacterium]
MQKKLISYIILFILSFILPLNSVLAQDTAPIPQPPPNREIIPEQTPIPLIAQPDDSSIFQNDDGFGKNLKLFAKLSENGAILQSGVNWRIFDASEIENGQMSLLFKSERAAANFNLKMGDYLIHAAYGNAQVSETITINSPATKTLIFEAGALRLKAAITGDIPIIPSNLKFEISANDGEINGKRIIAENVRPNDIIYLNAGTYNVTSYFGNVNAKVQADLRVEVGQITDATLYHDASKISFRLASEPNGKAIADVEWSVKEQDGEIVYTNLGAFPSTILKEGDYAVIAKIGKNVYNRDFQVKPSAPREVELLTSLY